MWAGAHHAASLVEAKLDGGERAAAAQHALRVTLAPHPAAGGPRALQPRARLLPSALAFVLTVWNAASAPTATSTSSAAACADTQAR